jgi:hemerythrin
LSEDGEKPVKIAWKQEFDIGIADIDAEHKHLVDLLNQVIGSISSQDKDKILNETMNAALIYTKSHFQREEEMLVRENYPAVDEHKTLHKALIQDIIRLRLRLLSGSPISVMELHKFFYNWLISHIKMEDKKYVKHLAQ